MAGQGKPGPSPRGVEARFWEKVDRSGGLLACWPWQGAYNTPQMRPWKGTRRPVLQVAKGLVVYATRLSLHLADGVPLEERQGLEACHTRECSNPSCVNPAHLYWGTPEQNRRDRYGR